MIETLVRPLADGFMQVGVFVALLVGAFAWLRWRYGDRLLALLERRRGFGPVVGALLGVSPGCAGALLLTPLYTRGAISFGTVVAGVAATMGDSSWVIFAAQPLMALKVHALLFATGVVTGYAVDALRLTPERLSSRGAEDHAPAEVRELVLVSGGARRTVGAQASAGGSLKGGAGAWTPGGVPGAASGAVAGDAAPAATAAGALRLALWVVAGLAALVAVPVAFQLVDAATLTRIAGGWDPYLVLGFLGTVLCAMVLVAHRGTAQHDDGISPQRPSIALAAGARELALIVVWVSVIYLAWTLVETLTGFDGSQLPLHDWLGVVVGACIGLIPGCAVQIAFTTLYLAGGVPLPTLVANAVSQDGDALLPLIARDARAAFLTTVLTTVPALAVGAVLLLAS
ncbi:putative manganese transporter [Streptomyces sp. NPDC045431]|uniref:putative manganese transporter n=1 Tax=Streptomyces sp. NPDC045431 TaxID=3155613 RepID=UPI0033E22A39